MKAIDNILNEILDIPDDLHNIKNRKQLAQQVYQRLLEDGISVVDADEWLFEFMYLPERQRAGANVSYNLVPDQEFDPVPDQEKFKDKQQTEKMDVKTPQKGETSIIDKIGYDESSNMLQINFSNGSIWRYMDVPAEVITKMKQSPNKQKFFYSNVRYKYPAKRIKSYNEPEMATEVLFVREEIKNSLKRGYQDTPDVTDKEVDHLAASIVNRNKSKSIANVAK